MQIQYLGHSSFRLTGKDLKGNNISLVTDPFGNDYGIKMPSVEADIVTVSHNHNDHNNIKAVKGDPYIIDVAGEYEIKDIFIQGIDSLHGEKTEDRGQNIIYRINFEDIVLAHLGDLGHVLDTKQIECLEGTDVLFIPVGGKYTLDAKKAVEVINQIEPRIVIPMHFKVKGLNMDINGVDKFIAELGLQPTEEDKIKINKKDLPQEDMELILLRS